jgi:hypothetical protein
MAMKPTLALAPTKSAPRWAGEKRPLPHYCHIFEHFYARMRIFGVRMVDAEKRPFS